jgi:plastocyanin
MLNKNRPHLAIVGLLSAAGIALLALAAACGSSDDDASASQAGERTIYVQATELDARRGTDQTDFPQHTRDAFPDYFGPADEPFESGGAPGYYLFMTEEDEWRIGSYMFLPQDIVVYQGEQITMEVLNVRGSEHKNTTLFDPDGEIAAGPFDMFRGDLHIFEFTAEKTGIYQFICNDHLPNMVMNIHVLPQ